MLVHPQLEAESLMLLGNRLNAALLWPHAPALSIFINLLNNLFFPHYLNTCERVCWVTGWAWAVSKKTNRDFHWSTDGDEQQPESSRGGQNDKSQRRLLLFPSRCSPHEDVNINEKKREKNHSRKRGRGNKVFMLGLKHAKLMAGLFCLAGEHWYWEEMEEGRPRRKQDMTWKLSSSAKFHFSEGLQSFRADSLPEREGSAGGYGKWCIHSVIQWLRNTLK